MIPAIGTTWESHGNRSATEAQQFLERKSEASILWAEAENFIGRLLKEDINWEDMNWDILEMIATQHFRFNVSTCKRKCLGEIPHVLVLPQSCAFVSLQGMVSEVLSSLKDHISLKHPAESTSLTESGSILSLVSGFSVCHP